MRKTLLASVAALALVATMPALADDQHQDHGKGQQGQSGGQAAGSGVHPDHGVGSGHTVGTQNGGSGGQSGGGMSGTTHHAHGNGGSGNAGNGSVGNNAMMGGSMSGTTHHAHGNGGTGNAGNNAMMGGGMTGSTHRSSHNNNNTAVVFGSGGHGYKNKSDFGHARHNSAFDALRRAYHATHHYHAGTYRRPPGYYYRTWNYGDFLPALFFDQQYFIDDFDDYGLADPPEGTVWVRYGDDALLVDEDTGEIIRVVYGIFY